MKEFSNNNPTDLNGYKEYMREQQNLALRLEQETKQARIEKNIDTWLSSIEYPWDLADMSYFTGRPVEMAKSIITKKSSCTFVMGGQRGGKTFFSYALIKELIKSGQVTPSQIRMTDIRSAVANINGMFQSRDWKESFFDPKAKLLVVEGCSQAFSTSTDKHQKEQMKRFWNELITHVQETNKILIVTYSLNNIEREGKVVLPALTNERDYDFYLASLFNHVKINEDTRNKDKQMVGR